MKNNYTKFSSFFNVITKLFLFVLFEIVSFSGFSQEITSCLKIQSILVNSCDNGSITNPDEGLQEMATFQVGPNDILVSDISIKWATPPDGISPWYGFIKSPTTAQKTEQLNNTITNGCGHLLEPENGVIPAHKKVLICTSYKVDPARNSFANLKDTMYVVYQNNPSNPNGQFRNLGGIRTFVIYYRDCTESATYNTDLLDPINGAVVYYDNYGNPTYANNNCQMPQVPASIDATAKKVYCENEVIQVAATSSFYITDLAWTGGNGGTFSNPNSLVSIYKPAPNETGAIKLRVSAKNCGDAIWDTVTVFFVKNTIDIGNNLICSDKPITLDASSKFESYLWQDGSASQTFTVTSSGTYRVDVADKYGCTYKDLVVVSVNNVRIGRDTICSDQPFVLDASDKFVSYLWQDGTANQTFSAATSGVYNVKVIDSYGCNYTDTAAVSINHIDIGAPVICAEKPVLLDVGKSFPSYLWQDGSRTRTVLAVSSNLYKVIVYDEFGCSFTDSAGISVNSINIGRDTICSDKPFLLDAGKNFVSYLWQDGSTTQTYSATKNGKYDVVALGDYKCVYKDEATIILNNIEGINLGRDSVLCESNQITFDAGSDFIIYHWQDGSSKQTLTANQKGKYYVYAKAIDGCSYTDTVIVDTYKPEVSIGKDFATCDQFVVLDAGNEYATYLWSDASKERKTVVKQTGTYSLTITDKYNCQNVSSIHVDFINEIKIENAAQTDNKCYGKPDGEILIKATGTGTINYGILSQTFQNSGKFTGLHNGKYDIVVKDDVCSDTVSFTLKQPTEVYFSFISENPTCIKSGKIDITPNGGIGNYALTCTDSTGSKISDLKTLTPNRYKVNLSDGNGCVAEKTITLVSDCYSTLTVPNVFSPNGDGANDVFKVNYEYLTSFKATIFDRWGIRVATWENPDSGWDGRISGSEASTGVYFYTIYATGLDKKVYDIKGPLHLFR